MESSMRKKLPLGKANLPKYACQRYKAKNGIKILVIEANQFNAVCKSTFYAIQKLLNYDAPTRKKRSALSERLPSFAEWSS